MTRASAAIYIMIYIIMNVKQSDLLHRLICGISIQNASAFPFTGYAFATTTIAWRMILSPIL